MNRRLYLVLALIGGLVVSGVGVARADRVVVLDVAGDGTHEIEQVLSSIIRDEHDVVSSKDFMKAARRAKVKRRDDAGLAKVAKKVKASAILEGSVGHADDALVLTVRIRDGAGKAIDEVTIGLNGPTLSERSRRKLGRQLLVALDKLSPSLDSVPVRPPLDDEPAEEEAPAAEAKAPAPAPPPAHIVTAFAPAGGEVDEPARAPAVAAPVRVASMTSTEVGDGGRVDAMARPAEPSAPPLAIRVEAGGSATGRSLTFLSRAGLQSPPAAYQSSPVPGAHVAAEVYPFAFATRGAASRLGLDAEYDQTFGATTATGGAMQVAVPTQQALIRVGARLRVVGATRDSTSLTLVGGYGQRVFLFDRTGAQAAAVADLPDVDYRFFDPGMALRVPIGDMFALSASARGVLIQSTGGIAAADQYGSSTAYGVDAEAGFEITLSRFLIHVSARLTEVDQQLKGDGAKANNRDNDPSTPDVAAVQDRYYGGAATLGVLY
jgi:hypothetical protein